MHQTLFSSLQRPVALAFLSSERPSVSQRLVFKNLTRDLFRPLLACNRRLFRSYAERIIEIANEIQQHKFHTYYNLQTTIDAQSAPLNAKIAQIARQASLLLANRNVDDAHDRNGNQQLNMQFMDVYRFISTQSSLCECAYSANKFDKFFALLDRPTSSQLLPLFELAPCVRFWSIEHLKLLALGWWHF